MYGQYMLIVLIGIVLAGCSDKEDAISGDTVFSVSKEDVSTSPSEPKPTPIEPNALGNLVEIKILPPEGQLSVPANSKMKLRIIGFYENGEEDLTEQAELRILDNVSNITFTEDNQVQAGVWDPSGASYNNTRIEAEFEDIKAELIVNVMEGVCDKALTLAQVESLDGTCVMSHTYDGKEYLFVPRKKFMDRLGYTASNIEENEGRTYAIIHNDSYPYALFRRDGKGITLENYENENNPYGQAERYCNDLVKMSFNNKDGWKMSTFEELEELIVHHKNNNLLISGGLPLDYFSIWNSDKPPSGMLYGFLNNVNGEKVPHYLSSRHAILCRSE
ncbi:MULTISPECIES: hypothetical protein [Vibrio]|uniref:hypothetical protein n=1 Tax=Vibrio TaxID=662 RepID=UPI0014935F89|nr:MULTISPECIES: hypothetical protein [Vibrio]NOI87885.1 hypothetical protein [Vibrio sp. 99K-1]NOI96724.1 hypothetical protein [Vibrio sp. T3Y01]